MKIDLADIFYLFGESPSSIFPLHFSYMYILVYILLRSKLTYQKNILFSFSRNIYAIILKIIYFDF